jgi:hypothetical protein
MDLGSFRRKHVFAAPSSPDKHRLLLAILPANASAYDPHQASPLPSGGAELDETQLSYTAKD